LARPNLVARPFSVAFDKREKAMEPDPTDVDVGGSLAGGVLTVVDRAALAATARPCARLRRSGEFAG
jgi:hypothetical protein